MWIAQWLGGQEGFETEAEAEKCAEMTLPRLASMNRYVVVFEIDLEAS